MSYPLYRIPDFGFRNLGIAFRAGEHWLERLFYRPARFPLDADGSGAVGWVHRRMVRWEQRKESCEFD